jgi:hypothetical protein
LTFGEFISEGKFRGAKAELNELSELLILGSDFAGAIRGAIATQSGTGGTGGRSAAGFTWGRGCGGCSIGFEETLGETGVAFGSNSRNN